MRRFIIWFLFFSTILSCAVRLPLVSPNSRSWTEISQLQDKEERITVLFLHTEWCRFCENMKESTWRDPALVSLLDEKFYFISFDAESTDKISMKGEDYFFKKTGMDIGMHELAIKLGSDDGRITFPTIVYLDHNLKVLYRRVGFQSAEDIKITLNQLLDLY